MADQSIGMMEGAFFVSKNEILSFVNNLLQLNLTRIEQLGTGAAYCQIFDSIFPGKLKMNRVNWKAKNEWEFIVNFKILQQAFEKCNMKKHIDIERLAKAKYQDNLEFAQWLKRFYETQENKLPQEYDPVKERNKHSEGNVDLSFLEYRDVPRKQSVKEDSMERNYNKKLISRSKSPIMKNLSNPPVLYSKSKEIQLSNKLKSLQQKGHQSLIERVKEIDKILENDQINEKQKVEQIQQCIDSCKDDGLLGFEIQNEIPLGVQSTKHYAHYASQQTNLRMEKEGDRIIEEEIDSPNPKISIRPKKIVSNHDDIKKNQSQQKLDNQKNSEEVKDNNKQSQKNMEVTKQNTYKKVQERQGRQLDNDNRKK